MRSDGAGFSVMSPVSTCRCAGGGSGGANRQAGSMGVVRDQTSVHVALKADGQNRWQRKRGGGKYLVGGEPPRDKEKQLGFAGRSPVGPGLRGESKSRPGARASAVAGNVWEPGCSR